MVSIVIIFLCISIQIIDGFTLITDQDEDAIKQNGKQTYHLALRGRRGDFTLRDFNLSAVSLRIDWILNIFILKLREV